MLLHSQYEFDPINDRIGQGGFATVYKARDINLDITVALKRYSKSDSEKGSVISEIRKCFRFNHPNIIRYYNCFCNTFTDHLGQPLEEEYGVMEYADGGHLGEIIEHKHKVAEAEFKAIILGILDGLDYLHSRNPAIIHRDLKPANILLSKEDGQLIPKICDFGISKVASTGTTTSTTTGFLGSIEYMAPEQLNMDKFGKDGHLQPNADLWALGCMLYEYFTRKSPFGKRSEGITPEVIYSNILSREPLHGYDAIPEPYKTGIHKCLEKDAGKRVMKAGEVKAILAGGVAVIETPPEVPNIPKEPHNPESNWSTYLLVFIWGIVVVGSGLSIISLHNESSEEATAAESEEPITYLTDAQVTNSKGETFTYTGYVDTNAIETEPEGQGKAVFANGDVYEGNFVNGLRQGSGKYIWSDGEYFIGEFNNSLRDGCGTWYSVAGEVLQKGKYVNGEFISEKCP